MPIGNPGSFQQQASDLCYVPAPTPYLLTASFWDEGGGQFTQYNPADGTVIGSLNSNLVVYAGGPAVCTDGTHIFSSLSTTYFQAPNYATYVVRSNLDGSPAPFSGGVGSHGNQLVINASNGFTPIYGLTTSGTSLFVVDPNTNRVLVFSLATMAQTSSFTLAGGRRIAYHAPTDSLWVSTGLPEQLNSFANYPNRNFAGSVYRVDLTGNTIIGPLTNVGIPNGLYVSGNTLYVADDGPDQQIKLFNASGSLIRTFGRKSGYLADPIGTVTVEKKFYHPITCTLDPAGNLYVLGGENDAIQLTYGRNAACWLAAFGPLPDRPALWRDYSAGSWDDCACPDLVNPGHLYTVNAHIDTHGFTADPGIAPFAMTTDQFTNPNDLRYFMFFPIVQSIQWVNGVKYMTVIDQYALNAAVFVFLNGSEIATPSAMFSYNQGIPGSPATPWTWNAQSGFASSPSFNYPQSWRMDSNGSMWTNNTTYISYLAPTFNQQYVNYNPYTTQSWAIPAPFTFVRDMYYDPASDAMWISGFTAANPAYSGEPQNSRGSTLCKYSGWIHGSQTLVYTILLPHASASNFIAAWDVQPADDIVVAFIEQTVNPNAPQHSGYFYTHGTLTTELVPTGAVGWVDQVNAVHIIKVSTGTYRVFVEQMISGNTTVFVISV